MEIIAVPCLHDNYAWLLRLGDGGGCAVVDPSEVQPVTEAMRARGLRLTAILATHHHPDHVGGIMELLDGWPGTPVYGHASDRGRIPGQTVELTDGASFDLGGHAVRALHVPGHTLGALAYVTDGAVFTGDTLFAGGCGRLFEGTPAMMYRSLVELLGALEPATRVYSGHEYTVANLGFAATMEPDNADVGAALDDARRARAAGRPTLPSTIARELATNPFMRVDQPSVQAAVGVTGPRVDVFAAVRTAKDRFVPRHA